MKDYKFKVEGPVPDPDAQLRAAYEAHIEAYRAKAAADHKGQSADDMAKADREAIEEAKATWTGQIPEGATE